VSDTIQLVLPAQEDFRPIAHLVVGGLAARLDLTFEELEDLQVAIEALLGRRDDDGEIVVTIDVEPNLVRTNIGPFPLSALAELDGADDGLGLRRVLETVCDTVEVDEHDGSSWVGLTKRTAASTGATS
jgi:hypothetical protein